MSDFSDRPFVAGSVTGIRSFNVDRFARLKATQLDVVWMPGENTARCFKDLQGPSGLFGSSFARLITQSYAIPSSIEGYGAVTVGSRGFRAEKARILALIIKPKRVTDETNRVRANYPLVPVFESKAAALEAFPLTPPAVPTPDSDPEFWTREAL